MADGTHPVAGVDYPRNSHELVSWFPDDGAWLRYLEQLREGEGFSCRFCGQAGGEYWRMGDGLCRCAACRRETSVTAAARAFVWVSIAESSVGAGAHGQLQCPALQRLPDQAAVRRPRATCIFANVKILAPRTFRSPSFELGRSLTARFGYTAG